MDFLSEYSMFLAKFSSVVILLLIAIGVIIILASRNKHDAEKLEVKNLNEKFETMSMLLNSQTLSKKQLKKFLKEKKQKYKEKDKTGSEDKKVFVLDFKGDIKASAVSSLREEISALLTVATDKDEVVVLIESGGGIVHGYGLGASQLRRIRDRGIKLTAAVDKVAASGGYMMACVANQIIAAPFAILGSVGVLAQIPNFNRLLKKMDIDYEQITAGEYKRTLTLFGENTDADREKFQRGIRRNT